METSTNLDIKLTCRVLLRGDGSVHICFPNVRAVEATPNALFELFTNPFEFIITGSLAYKDSSFQINRKRKPLHEITGLTLARVNQDKTILLDFPELISAFLAARDDADLKDKPLNMRYFQFQDEFADEKSYMVRYFLEAANYFNVTPSIKRNISLRPEAQVSIMREIVNAFYADELPTPTSVPDVDTCIDQAESDLLLQASPPEEPRETLSLEKYALHIGKSPDTVRKYIKEGRIKSARKNDMGHWEIDINDVPAEWNLNKGRKRQLKVEGKHYKRPNNGSAAEVQEHARKMRFFTEDVIPYLITFQEMQYYVDHNYHQVQINGRHCLIVDVNPDYISTKTGKSNRELMAEGKAPVVPQRDREEFVFNVHHLGQQRSSPFCLVPSYDHNSSTYYNSFHPVRQKEENLHDAEFYAKCNQLWKTLLEMYDTFHSYRKIPYLNPRYREPKKR